MKVSVLLLLCAHVLCTRAGRIQGPPEPELMSVACMDPQAEAVADLSLRQLNAHRKEGFVFGLKQIVNVQEQYDEENGSVFYLTLFVVETDCHVLSRKLWKECGGRQHYERVFGECKVIFQLNKPKRIAHLHYYDCTVTGARGDLFSFPSLPLSQPLNDTNVVEIAKKSVPKFNSESNINKFFLLGNITKATRQVVAGTRTAYLVEYTIQESTCNISAEDLSQCEPLDCEYAHTGYCKAVAVAHWSTPDDKAVKTISCDIFEPEAAIVEEQNHQAGHAKDKKNEPGHDSGSHEHEHKHDHEHLHSYEHYHATSRGGHGPKSETPKTKGTVSHRYRDKTSAASGAEDKKEKGGKPHRGDKGNPPKSFIRAFPDKASTSNQCPGLRRDFPVRDIPIIEAPEDPTRIPNRHT